MVIDYISDLHENFYVGRHFFEYEHFINFIWGDTHKDGDILILAGDISERIEKLVEFLHEIRRVRNYQHIFYVPGNHDLYRERINGIDILRLEEKYQIIKKALIPLEGIHFLDGDIHMINGLRISGLSMWYDMSYFQAKRPYLAGPQLKKAYLDFWKMYMLDSSKTTSDPIAFFDWQKSKFEGIYKNVDIFVSHINPVNVDSFFSPRYAGEEGNTFFCFDGIKYLEEGSIKHWFFGHTHDPIEGEIFDTLFHCNPLGYPGENPKKESFISQIKV